MTNQYRLLIALAFLIGINVLLYHYYRQKTSDLSLAHSALSRNEVFEFMNDRKYLSHQAEKLGIVSNGFSESLDSMRRLATNHTQRTTSYFVPAALVDQQSQNTLWLGFRDFHESCARYLEMELPKAKDKLIQTSHSLSRDYATIESQAKRSPNGRGGRGFLDLRLSNEESFPIRLQWRKADDSVHWSENRAYYVKYSAKLEQMIRASDASRARKLLKKMEKAFPMPGVIVAFNKEYRLSNISPAELTSVCKYLEFSKNEVLADIIATHSEVTLFD